MNNSAESWLNYLESINFKMADVPNLGILIYIYKLSNRVYTSNQGTRNVYKIFRIFKVDKILQNEFTLRKNEERENRMRELEKENVII